MTSHIETGVLNLLLIIKKNFILKCRRENSFTITLLKYNKASNKENLVQEY